MLDESACLCSFANVGKVQTHLLRVRVPVLSEQSTSIPDSSSKADNLQDGSVNEVSLG